MCFFKREEREFLERERSTKKELNKVVKGEMCHVPVIIDKLLMRYLCKEKKKRNEVKGFDNIFYKKFNK